MLKKQTLKIQLIITPLYCHAIESSRSFIHTITDG